MILMRFPNGLAKALTFSYDDCVEQDMELVRIFNQYGMKATFNLNTAQYAPEGRKWREGQFFRKMSRSQTIDLFKDGPHEVAVHCANHQLLTNAPTAMIVAEVMEDRKSLEHDFGGIVRSMAYPYGPVCQTAVDALQSCGILFARTIEASHRFDIPADWLRLPPTCHHADPRLMELADSFLQKQEPAIYGCQLFYVWGHSFEFETNRNWHVIHDFCEKMTGKDDIWYATNGEIFEYVEAWQKLICSADGKTLFNPTARTLWLRNNRNILSIGPGETAVIE